jgi:plastocyanin
MRRTIAATVGLALLAAPLLSASQGSILHGSRAEAAECTWQRHSRRVVKHLRRHGRVRRIVIVKHSWSCEETPAAPVVAPTPTPAPPVIPPVQPEPEANALSVTSRDQAAYSYTLSRPQTKDGELTVELNNQGEDPHNLNIQLASGEGATYKIAKTEPSEHQVASFDLPAGTYRLWCSFMTHDEKGMHATLVVGP